MSKKANKKGAKKKEAKSTGVKCGVCGKVCKSEKGLATHMRTHKRREKEVVQGVGELVRLLSGAKGGSADNQGLMDHAKEVDVLMETFAPVQSKRSIERLDRLSETRDALDKKIAGKIQTMSEAPYTSSADLMKASSYLTAQIESEQAAIKNLRDTKGLGENTFTAILNQIMTVNSMEGGADLSEFDAMNPGDRERVRRMIEKALAGDIIDVEPTSAS